MPIVNCRFGRGEEVQEDSDPRTRFQNLQGDFTTEVSWQGTRFQEILWEMRSTSRTLGGVGLYNPLGWIP